MSRLLVARAIQSFLKVLIEQHPIFSQSHRALVFDDDSRDKSTPDSRIRSFLDFIYVVSLYGLRRYTANATRTVEGKLKLGSYPR